MKITGSTTTTVTTLSGTAGATGSQAVAAPVQTEAPAAALQSDVLKPAAQALRAMPDFDAARVAELRALLERGELPFDPARLAGLIQKFHGGR